MRYRARVLAVSINRWRIELIATDVKRPEVQHTTMERGGQAVLQVDQINDCTDRHPVELVCGGRRQ